MGFPDGFVWGAAAASYQIEGAVRDDGRGLSVWDVFSHTPGKVFNGETGDVACDHYHRYEGDVALMKEIGLQAYRFSISWSRVLPDGTGAVNDKGLDFYDRLVDELLENGIMPYATLFHWDLPWALHCRGGWLNRDIVNWFTVYTDVVVRKLGDRVRHWMTLNEPSIFVNLGYWLGEHAPGFTWSDPYLFRILHHVMLTHGVAAQAIRAASPQAAQVGLAMATIPIIPAVDDEAHISAAKNLYQGTVAEATLWNDSLWLDPILKGAYQQKALDLWGAYLPIEDGDLDNMHQPLDFLGLNIYRGSVYRMEGAWSPEGTFDKGYPRTMMDWSVTPQALYWGPRFMYEKYGLPILITENGLASMDWIAVDGKVHDPNRIDFLHRYLSEYKRAAEDGVDLHGYLQWSIMDNFEWAEGYRKRFGLIYVDYQTQERILKDSAYWYADVIANNGASLG